MKDDGSVARSNRTQAGLKCLSLGFELPVFRSNDDADLIRLNRSNALSLEHRSAAKLVTDGGDLKFAYQFIFRLQRVAWIRFGDRKRNHVAGLDEGTAIADGDGEKHFIGLQVKFHWRRLIILLENQL